MNSESARVFEEAANNLRAQVKKDCKEIEDYKTECKYLRTENNELKTRLREVMFSRDELEKEHCQLKSENQKLKIQVDSLIAVVKILAIKE